MALAVVLARHRVVVDLPKSRVLECLARHERHSRQIVNAQETRRLPFTRSLISVPLFNADGVLRHGPAVDRGGHVRAREADRRLPRLEARPRDRQRYAHEPREHLARRNVRDRRVGRADLHALDERVALPVVPEDLSQPIPFTKRQAEILEELDESNRSSIAEKLLGRF